MAMIGMQTQGKPEANVATIGMQTQGKPEASMAMIDMETQGKPRVSMPMIGGRISPDSLIPDSLIPDVLIPDSLNPEREGAHCAENAPSVLANVETARIGAAESVEPALPAQPDPMPAPLAQDPSPFDGWIFAASPPTEPEPASDAERAHLVPESAVTPEPASVLLAQAESLFDDTLLADDKFALTPEDEAEVAQILFGKPPPPPPPAEKKSRTAKVGNAASKVATKAATKAERATRIAENWTLSEHNRQWAKAKRPELDLDLEAEKFHNHWLGVGGKDARKVNWDATWRKWVMNAWGNPRTNTGQHYSRHTPRHDPLEILAI